MLLQFEADYHSNTRSKSSIKLACYALQGGGSGLDRKFTKRIREIGKKSNDSIEIG